MWASRYEHSVTVKLLLDKGAKIDIADKVRHVICLQYVIDRSYYGENKGSEYKCVHHITNSLPFCTNLITLTRTIKSGWLHSIDVGCTSQFSSHSDLTVGQRSIDQQC
jgi:hypothetical protein